MTDTARPTFAWWYACGRNDERRGHPAGVTLPYVDPDKFALFDTTANTGPYSASIQDTFDCYRAMKVCPGCDSVEPSLYSIQGTDHLSPQFIEPTAAMGFHRSGFTITIHRHKEEP